LPENIRYSETFAVPAATLVRVVRENGLEGIVAKRAGSVTVLAARATGSKGARIADRSS
jgi:ATP-dependent DNA ligase